MHSILNLATSVDDTVLIEAIVDRARREIPKRFSHPVNWCQLMLDLTVCHGNGNPLRLAELLDAPDVEFRQELLDISSRLNRHTGVLDPSYTPRFAMPTSIP